MIITMNINIYKVLDINKLYFKRIINKFLYYLYRLNKNIAKTVPEEIFNFPNLEVL